MTNLITLKEQVRQELHEGRGKNVTSDAIVLFTTRATVDFPYLDELIDRTALAVLQMVEEGILEQTKKHGELHGTVHCEPCAYGDIFARISALKDSFSGEGV